MLNETIQEYHIRNLELCKNITILTTCDQLIQDWKDSIEECEKAIGVSEISDTVDSMRFWANECLRRD